MNEIEKTVLWLKENRNSDKGWGELPSHPTKIINTGEITAGLILSKECDPDFLNASLSYLDNQIIDGNCNSISQLCWATIPILLSRNCKNYKRSILISLSQIIETKQENGGWGESKDPPSRVYTTVLVLRVLTLMKQKKAALQLDSYDIETLLKKGLAWLLSQQNNDGGWGEWGKSLQSQSRIATTSHVMILLNDYPDCHNTKQCQKAINDAKSWLLLQQENTGEFKIEDEEGIGENKYKWIHFSTAWAIAALMKTGVNISSQELQKAIHYFLKLQKNDGSWEINSMPFTWAAFNAIYTLTIIYQNNPLLSEEKYTSNKQEQIEFSKKLNLIGNKNLIIFSLGIDTLLIIIIIVLLASLLVRYFLKLLAIVIFIYFVSISFVLSKMYNQKWIEYMEVAMVILSLIMFLIG